MMPLSPPTTHGDLAALAARLRRQTDPGRTIVLALIMRDAITATALARPEAERGFLDYAANYLDGLAEGTEALFFAPPADATRH